ncbi:glycosyltransferase [Staphylococcus simulans]|uniref:glycosyltransferase family 2 protein n=1 Tax=Staphylococcus simulans TaxID=1286 RepID=UPI0021D08CD0|nr:glycosyltransferase family 2 protein [Staphylococcus simulans]UXR29512.1 glycosyltransferase [Staphylococcus simulans]
MKETIDITVVIPYFRSSKTIKRAVDSVLQQTRLPKEILIIDDYSNTKLDQEILKEIENIELVRVIFSKNNSGPGGARNIGIENAQSKYIAFLDSDDVWKKRKLETQFNYMEKYGAFLSGHHSSIFGAKEIDKSSFVNVSPIKQLLKNRFGTRTVMMRNNRDYKFKEDKRYSEDFLLWSQIVLDKKKSIIINKTLAHSFKEDYGDSGLTGNVNNMYFGAIDAYRILVNESKINSLQFALLVILQSLKQILRLFKIKVRKIEKR